MYGYVMSVPIDEFEFCFFFFFCNLMLIKFAFPITVAEFDTFPRDVLNRKQSSPLDTVLILQRLWNLFDFI